MMDWSAHKGPLNTGPKEDAPRHIAIFSLVMLEEKFTASCDKCSAFSVSRVYVIFEKPLHKLGV